MIGTRSLSEDKWHVEWYKINKNTLEFEKLIGTETWPAGNFEYDWLISPVYDNMRDYIGFIAVTKIYSRGGTYKFMLYNVNDVATLFVDDEEILHVTGTKWVEVNLSKGMHTLKIEWKEYCCSASIGFRTNETLYMQNKNNKRLPIEATFLFILIIACAIFISIYLSLYIIKDK